MAASMAADWSRAADACVDAIHRGDEVGLRAQLGLLSRPAQRALLLSAVDEPLPTVLPAAAAAGGGRSSASRGNSLLHLCAESGGFAECARALLETAASLAATLVAPPSATLVRDVLLSANLRGLTPLHVAAQAGALACARLLLDAAPEAALADLLDARNEWRETALHLAAAAGRAPVVALLVEASARAGVECARATDRWGRSAARVAREQGATEALLLLGDNVESAHEPAAAPCAPREAVAASGCALSSMQLELMAAVAKRRAAPPEDAPRVEPSASSSARREPPPQQQPSAHAAPSSFQNGQPRRALSKLIEFQIDTPEFERLVLDEAVDPAGRDAFGLSALHKAAAWDRPELVAALLDGGGLGAAECNAAAGSEQWTPLHHAAAAGAQRAYALLCGCERVDRTLVDAAGRTAAELLPPPS